MGKVLNCSGIDGQHMHIDRQRIAQLSARIGQTRPVIQRKVHGLRVQDLAAFAVFRDIAIGQNLRDVLLRYDLPFKFKRGVQTIAARLGTRETGNHVIHADVRHFLSRLQRGAHSALCPRTGHLCVNQLAANVDQVAILHPTGAGGFAVAASEATV